MRLQPTFDTADQEGLARHFEEVTGGWGSDLSDMKPWQLMVLADEACRWFTKNPPNWLSPERLAREERENAR